MFPVFRVDNYISPTQQYVVSRAWNPIIVKKCSLLFILQSCLQGDKQKVLEELLLSGREDGLEVKYFYINAVIY